MGARVSELFTGYISREGALPASPGSCAHVAALKIIQSYGRCLPQNPSLVTPALQFIVGRLADQNTAAAAAKAFEAVSSLPPSDPPPLPSSLPALGPYIGGIDVPGHMPTKGCVQAPQAGAGSQLRGLT